MDGAMHTNAHRKTYHIRPVMSGALGTAVAEAAILLKLQDLMVTLHVLVHLVVTMFQSYKHITIHLPLQLIAMVCIVVL